MKKIVLALSVVSVLFAAVLWSCSKTQAPLPAKELAAIPPVAAAVGACNCGNAPTNCKDFVTCVERLIGKGATSKTFTVNWASCVSPDPSDRFCNGFGISGAKSTLKICYLPNSCDHVTAIISNPPSCLPCLSNPYCIPLAANCGNSTFTFSNLELDPLSNTSIRVTITGDPKIAVTCSDSQGNNYNCVGDL